MIKILFTCLFSIPLCLLHGGKIAIVSWAQSQKGEITYLHQRLLDESHTVDHVWEDDDLAQFDVIISDNYKHFLHNWRHKVIISCYEPEVIIEEHGDFNKLEGYLAIFTWNHDICDKKGFYKFHYPTSQIVHYDHHHPKDFETRKLACLINSYVYNDHSTQLYSMRQNVVKYYQKKHPTEFSLYGMRGWDLKNNPVYKGSCEDKGKIFHNHKFCFCFENWDNDYHYITEKIFDCLNNFCVPIYLGCSRITDYIPKEAFINARHFESIHDIHEFISTMDKNTYQTYIDAIRKFSRSEIPFLYTEENHKQQIIKIIDEYLNPK